MSMPLILALGRSRLRMPAESSARVTASLASVIGGSRALTLQMKDKMQNAEDNGLDFDFYVRSNTAITGPLQHHVMAEGPRDAITGIANWEFGPLAMVGDFGPTNDAELLEGSFSAEWEVISSSSGSATVRIGHRANHYAQRDDDGIGDPHPGRGKLVHIRA